MSTSTLAASPTSIPAPSFPALSPDALAAAFRAEARLLGELMAIIRRQREGVAADDVQAVDDSVFAAHRVLHTIGEARRHRRELLSILAGSEEVGVQELEEALGPWMTEAVRDARDELQRTARTLSHEIELNRQVIQAAIRAGDEYMRAICGVPQRSVCYSAGARSVDDSRSGGLLLNRQV
jgi:predicted RNase H-like nuclease (RuvC/YqgF family)